MEHLDVDDIAPPSSHTVQHIPKPADLSWGSSAAYAALRDERQYVRPASSFVGALVIIAITFIGATIFLIASFSNIQAVRNNLLTVYDGDDDTSA